MKNEDLTEFCKEDGVEHIWVKHLKSYEVCSICGAYRWIGEIKSSSFINIKTEYPMPQTLNKLSIQKLLSKVLDKTILVEQKPNLSTEVAKDLNEIRIKLVELKEEPTVLIDTISKQNLFTPNGLSLALNSALRTRNVGIDLDLIKGDSEITNL